MLQLISPLKEVRGPLDEAATLRILNAFAVDVMSIPSAEDLFWYVAQNVVGQLNFVDCVIYQANDAQTELVQVAAMGEKNPFGRSIINPLRIPFGQGITGRVAQMGEAIIVEDLLKDDNYIPDTQLARSEICVPMVFRNRVVGVIDSEHPQANKFGDAELEVLTTVAAMTSAKLELLAESERSNRRYQDLVSSHHQLTEEISNRKALEEKLFEARKLEAVGRLTGGFAHDFNNLLTVISGNLELMGGIVENKDAQELVEDAQAAADRGAKLIENMLSFSQRSRLKPKDIFMDDVIQTVSEWAKRALPDNVSLKLELGGALWPVWADQNAAENALFNLVLNARDAMPDGGGLLVSAENTRLMLPEIQKMQLDLPPGAYVRVNVQDTGCGITQEQLQRIFDPFYTTKDVGAGSGLGLSTILGFMQQSGGTVSVTSQVGAGSNFELYFPARVNAAEPSAPEDRGH